MTPGHLILLAAETADAATEGGGGFISEAISSFNEGGTPMWFIAAIFVIGLAIIVERTIVLFFTGSMSKDGLIRGLKKHIYAGDLDKAINYVAGQKSTPLTNIIKSGLMNVPKGEEEVQAALDEAALRENPRLEARTGYLAMLGNAAMLTGLFGTVHGLIGSFKAVAHASPADRSVILAGSIGEAMNCTQFGLLSSIPLLVMFSVLNGRTQSMLNDVNETSVAVLNLIVQNKDKFKNLNVPAQAED
jgi:biopolymer transport protein ExbB/TolQ